MSDIEIAKAMLKACTQDMDADKVAQRIAEQERVINDAMVKIRKIQNDHAKAGKRYAFLRRKVDLLDAVNKSPKLRRLIDAAKLMQRMEFDESF